MRRGVEEGWRGGSKGVGRGSKGEGWEERRFKNRGKANVKHMTLCASETEPSK